MDLDRALDELFGVTLDAFTKERDRLVKELKDAGKTDAAAEVKALKKPSVSTWAVNQLARRHTEEVGKLVELHRELEGSLEPKEVRRVQEERKRSISRLTDAAGPILEGAGHSASSTTMQRVLQSLLSASSREDLDALQRGRLATDLESSGFGALSGFEFAADSGPFQKTEQKERNKAEELSRRASDAETYAHDARRAADAAMADAERLLKEAERAEKRAEAARAKADAALDRLA